MGRALPLLFLVDLASPFVDDIEPIIQVDRLRTLSGVVKHLELPGFAEGEKLALRDQVSAT